MESPRLSFLFLLIYEIEYACASWRLNPPTPFFQGKDFFAGLYMVHIIEMTEELVKDCDLKLKQTKIIQNTYKGLLAYQLGTVAAGIENSFRRMIKIYRFYSNITSFVLPEDHPEYNDYDSMLNGFFVCQGEYNKIRLEIDLYNEIKNRELRARVLGSQNASAQLGAPKRPAKDNFYEAGNKFYSNRPNWKPPSRRNFVTEPIPSRKYQKLFSPGKESDVALKYSNPAAFGRRNFDMDTQNNVLNVPEMSGYMSARQRSVPQMSAPQRFVPRVSAPEISIRRMSASEFSVPDMSASSYIPRMSAPDIVPQMSADMSMPNNRSPNRRSRVEFPFYGDMPRSVRNWDGRRNKRPKKKPLWRPKEIQK